MTSAWKRPIGGTEQEGIDARRRVALQALGAGALLPLGSGIVRGGSQTEIIRAFDPTEAEFPESITIDRRGNKYLSMPGRGEIRKISSDNESESALATLDFGDDGLGVTGVEVAPNGVVYANLVSFNSPGSDTHGVWRISRDGTTELFAALDPATFPNDSALLGHALLVTDSIGGQILRATFGDTDVWLNDPLLDGTGAFGLGFPVGANGIATSKDGTVHVVNSEEGRVVRVPVNPDGSAGTPTIFAADPVLVGADGIAFDTRSNLYAAIIAQNLLVRVSPSGSIETLADATDGLDAPSDVAFGTSRGEQKRAFVTNFAFPEFSPDPDPTLMGLDIGIPGLPVRR